MKSKCLYSNLEDISRKESDT